jgi:ATP-dependent Clp endopeptidase proteolytic subunit ClpP
MNWKYKTAADESTENTDVQYSPNITITNTSIGSGTVKVVENTIFFYSDVTEQSALDLNAALFELDSKLKITSNFLGSDFKPHIKLRINSYGGSLFAGLAILDQIRGLYSDVYTYVDGAAASAATIITVAGTKRFIGKNSLMLIHQLSTGNYGKYSELEDDMENNKRLMKAIKDIYKQYTKVPMKNIDEILKHDLWFDSSKCLEYGLVDTIM